MAQNPGTKILCSSSPGCLFLSHAAGEWRFSPTERSHFPIRWGAHVSPTRLTSFPIYLSISALAHSNLKTRWMMSVWRKTEQSIELPLSSSYVKDMPTCLCSLGSFQLEMPRLSICTGHSDTISFIRLPRDIPPRRQPMLPQELHSGLPRHSLHLTALSISLTVSNWNFIIWAEKVSSLTPSTVFYVMWY